MALLDNTIELMDKNGVVRIRIGIDDKHGPYLSINDAVGRERLILGVNDDGNGGVAFRTATGQPIASFGVSPEFGQGMMLLDVQNETCITLSILDGSGEIRLETKQGVHTWPAPGAGSA